jgi:hypothetical protein
MDGHATLDQLLNSPPGTIFKERRGATFAGMMLGGKPTQAEYRSSHRAGRFSGRGTPAEMQRRLEEQEALIAGTRDEKLNRRS